MSGRLVAKARAGEKKAAEHLEGLGYRILARNYRCRRGEVDIVARRDDQLVFAEVKTWDALDRAELERSIGARKQQRIIQTSRVFLMEHPEFADSIVRYDVLFLSDGLRCLEHIEAAF